MFLWWSSTKIVQAIWICQKTWPPGGGPYFPYTVKPVLVVTSIKQPTCIKQPEKSCPKIHIPIYPGIWTVLSSHLPSAANFKLPMGGCLRQVWLYIYIENFKNLLVRNHRTNFNIILQKCSFGDPLPRLFKPLGFVKKHGRQGAGLIFPIYLYKIF